MGEKGNPWCMDCLQDQQDAISNAMSDGGQTSVARDQQDAISNAMSDGGQTSVARDQQPSVMRCQMEDKPASPKS